MADGQFDILKTARTAIEADPPGANHFCIFMDTENADALTMATGDPAVFSVLFSAPMEITPAQLTADTDNWDPDDILVATVVRISADAAWNLTGINSADLPAQGKHKKLINVGSFPITLKDQDTGSLSANRFLLLGGTGDITLQPGDAQDIYYDDTEGKWRSA
jgi:hypothetical protein